MLDLMSRCQNIFENAEMGSPTPPASLDIVPSDYHLFRSITYGLSEQKFSSYEDEDPKNESIRGSPQKIPISFDAEFVARKMGKSSD